LYDPNQALKVHYKLYYSM